MGKEFVNNKKGNKDKEGKEYVNKKKENKDKEDDPAPHSDSSAN